MSDDTKKKSSALGAVLVALAIGVIGGAFLQDHAIRETNILWSCITSEGIR